MKTLIEICQEKGISIYFRPDNDLPAPIFKSMNELESLINEVISQRLGEPVKGEREKAIRECAEIVGKASRIFNETKEAHERNSKHPFDPLSIGFNMELVKYSKFTKMQIMELIDPII